MSATGHAEEYRLGDRNVRRLGYGTMQLAGPGVFGPPADPPAAIGLLRTAIELGVNHIDTSDYYGPHFTNLLIREALHPYRDGLTIATKVGARRDRQGRWLPALSPYALTMAVHDNLRNLGLNTLDLVNLRIMFGTKPTDGSIAEPLSILADLKRLGHIRHIGLSNVTLEQVLEARSIVDIACVQNHYNIAHREDDGMIDYLCDQGIPYVPLFPLTGLTTAQLELLSKIATMLHASPMQVALSWLLQRSSNILLIPGTASVKHLTENMSVEDIALSLESLDVLDQAAS